MYADGASVATDGARLNMDSFHPATELRPGDRLRLIGLGGGNDENGVEHISQARVVQQSVNGFSYLGDFTRNFTEAVDDGGEIFAGADEAGAPVQLGTNDADDDAEQRTHPCEGFKLVANKPLYMEFMIKPSEASAMDWMIGLIETEDLSDVADNMPAEGVVFKCDDGDANIDFAVCDGGTNGVSSAIGTIASTAYTRLSMFYDGKVIKVYVNGVLAATVTSGFPQDKELAFSVLARTGAAEIEYVRFRADIAQVL